MSNSCIWLICRALSGATIPGRSGPWSDGIEEVLHIPRRSIFLRASGLVCFILYPGHLLGVLLLCRNAAGVFYSPRWLGWHKFGLVVDSYKRCLRDSETHLKSFGLVQSVTQLCPHSMVHADQNGTFLRLVSDYSIYCCPFFLEESFAAFFHTSHWNSGPSIHSKPTSLASDWQEAAKSKFQPMKNLGIIHSLCTQLKKTPEGVTELVILLPS